jgi:glycosyltransferase involved in cell wall biosynthesis
MKGCGVTAIVCAYNEEDTISGVLKALILAREIEEIIVINDGSTDGTSETLEKFYGIKGIRIIELLSNKGKGFAMAEGVIHARTPILVFVDADLLNFDPRFVGQLVSPLLEKKADMVIGHPTENDLDHWLNPFKPISGERALFKEDILPLIEQMQKSRYGVETLINFYYRAKRKRVVYVPLWGLIHPTKLQKYSLRKATYEYWQESYQIARTIIGSYSLILPIIRDELRR